MLKPPYLLVSVDVDPANPAAPGIIADVLAGFPTNAVPQPLPVENCFFIEVPSSQATTRFNEVAMYLRVQDGNHGDVLRWVVQLCRVDEVDVG